MFSEIRILGRSDSDFAPEGSCQFVGERLFSGSVGRRCGLDCGPCFSFDKIEQYCACPTRRKELRRRGR